MNKDILQGFQKESDLGEIELDIGNDLFNFQWAEFAPPSGAMAANYSRHFYSFFLFNFSYYFIDLFTENKVNHTDILSHGQWTEHWPMIKEGTFIIATMEFVFKEVVTQLLHGTPHIFMEQAYKTIHLLHKPFLSSTRLG